MREATGREGKEDNLWQPTWRTDKIGEKIFLSGIICQNRKDRNCKGKGKSKEDKL